MLQPRQVMGEGNFDKRTFYTGEGLGTISQISMGWPADLEGAEIAVVGSHGADFVDSSGRRKKQVRFSIEQVCPVVLARTGPAGEYGYLTREQSWFAPATLFDKEGHVIWHSGGTWPGVDDSTSGDVFGDGRLSIAVGFNGAGGLALFDEQGKKLWDKLEANVWHVEILDTNGDGREEILHSNAKGQLLVRNGNGDIVAQYMPGEYVSHFSIARWGQETRPSHILVPITKTGEGCCNRVFVLLDAAGKKIAELDSPMGDLFHQMSATSIRFGNGTQDFAVLENDSASDRSMLILYAEDGQIVYQEILGESCLGMAMLPKPDGERLLVGCAAKIWEYSRVLPTSTAGKKNTL